MSELSQKNRESMMLGELEAVLVEVNDMQHISRSTRELVKMCITGIILNYKKKKKNEHSN